MSPVSTFWRIIFILCQLEWTFVVSFNNFSAIECPLGCMNDEATDCINNGYNAYYKALYPASSFCSLSSPNCGDILNAIECPKQCIPSQKGYGCTQCIINGYKCYYIDDEAQLYPFCSSDTFILSSHVSNKVHTRDNDKEAHIHYNIHNHYKIYKFDMSKTPQNEAYYISYAQCPNFCIQQANNCNINDTLCYLNSINIPEYTICAHYPLECIFPFIPCPSQCLSMQCSNCHMNGNQCCFNATNVMCSDNCLIVNDAENVAMPFGKTGKQNDSQYNMQTFAWLSLFMGIIIICIMIWCKIRHKKGYVSVDTV